MANRFTDSRKWRDPWFRKLPLIYKIFWLYMLDECNHAGIFKPDMELASFCIGKEIDKETVLFTFNEKKERIVVINDEKWFLPGFVNFQYKGVLRQEVKCQKSVLNIIKNEGVQEILFKAYPTLSKGLSNPYLRVKDKDKDKDRSKDQTNSRVTPDLLQSYSPLEVEVEVEVEEERERDKTGRFTPPALHDIIAYSKEIGASLTDPEVFFSYYEANGWKVGRNKMKDWKAAFRNWEHREKASKNPKGGMEDVARGNYSKKATEV